MAMPLVSSSRLAWKRRMSSGVAFGSSLVVTVPPRQIYRTGLQLAGGGARHAGAQQDQDLAAMMRRPYEYGYGNGCLSTTPGSLHVAESAAFHPDHLARQVRRRI